MEFIELFNFNNTISNYYGKLEIGKTKDLQYFWCLEDWGSNVWFEIPQKLYNELKRHYLNTESKLDDVEFPSCGFITFDIINEMKGGE